MKQGPPAKRPRAVIIASIALAAIFTYGLVHRLMIAQSPGRDFYGMWSIQLVLEFVTVWFIFRGKNWGRWLLLVAYLVGLSGTIESFQQHSLGHRLTYVACFALELGILFLLFSRTSNSWFRRHEGT